MTMPGRLRLFGVLVQVCCPRAEDFWFGAQLPRFGTSRLPSPGKLLSSQIVLPAWRVSCESGAFSSEFCFPDASGDDDCAIELLRFVLPVLQFLCVLMLSRVVLGFVLALLLCLPCMWCGCCRGVVFRWCDGGGCDLQSGWLLLVLAAGFVFDLFVCWLLFLTATGFADGQ